MGFLSDLTKEDSKWCVRYWKMDEVERTTDFFQTQEEAQNFSLAKQKHGYLTIVSFDPSKSEDKPLTILAKSLIALVAKWARL